MCSCCNCCCLTKPRDLRAHTEKNGVFTKDRSRGCTDILFLLAWIAGWVCIAAIFSAAAGAGGDPNKILRGTDYLGRICGKSNGVEGAPYAAWPMPAAYEVQVCVPNCNFTSSDTNFMLFNYPSTKFLYYCIPGNFSTSFSFLNKTLSRGFNQEDGFDSPSNMASRAMGDMLIAWPVILISAFIALIVSYVYVSLSKHAGYCLVYTVILLILAAGLLLGLAFLVKANKVKAEADAQTPALPSNQAKAMYVLAYCTWGLVFIFFCVIIFLRDRIAIAVEVVKEAARAIEDMRLIILFPLIPFFVVCGYVVFWVSVTLWIFSASNLTDAPMPSYITDYPFPPAGNQLVGLTTFRDFEWNQSFKGLFAIHFFHLLWNVNFVIYFCYLTTAGAVANWYFSRPEKPGDGESSRKRGEGIDELPVNAVSSAAKRTLLHHLGTVAFGALVIAIIQAVRAFLAYVELKTRKRQNAIVRCVFACVACCLKCFQTCMEKVSKNAYIWTAIWGDSFIVAACSSFELVWSNLARVFALNMVSGFLMLLGRVLVALATAGICGFIAQGMYGDELNSLVMPMVVCFILAFLVASMFMVVVETTIDTIFICFLIDETLNKDTPQFYGSKALLELITSHSDLSAKKAAEVKEAHAARQAALNGPPPGAAPAAGAATPAAAQPDAGPPPSAEVKSA